MKVRLKDFLQVPSGSKTNESVSKVFLLLHHSRNLSTDDAWKWNFQNRAITIPSHPITIPSHPIPLPSITIPSPYHAIPSHPIPSNYHIIPYHYLTITIPSHYHTISYHYHSIPYHTIPYHSHSHTLPFLFFLFLSINLFFHQLIHLTNTTLFTHMNPFIAPISHTR